MTVASKPRVGFSPHVVNAPIVPGPGLAQGQGWSQVALRADHVQGGADLVARLAPWRRVTAVRRLRLGASENPEPLFGAVGEGIRVDCVVDPSAGAWLPRVAPSRWRHAGVVAWAEPGAVTGQALLETVRLAGSAGWPVSLPPHREILCGHPPLLEILDFYLFHPGLAVPVEPFHGLLIGLLSRRPRTLWEHWFAIPTEHFYVSAQGEVSLCESWAAQGQRSYGRREDAPEGWRASEAHAELRAILGGEVRPDPACGSCEAEGACRGALLSLEPEARCDLFVEVMVRLKLAAASLTRRRVGHSCS